MRRHRIAAIPGDGIGPEVMAAATGVLAAVSPRFGFALDIEHLPYSADHFLATGETLPDHAFEHLRKEADAILLGAVGDPRVPDNRHAREILLELRVRLDLYINLRPVKLLHPDLSPFGRAADGTPRRIDIVVFRENTEGVYLGRGRTEGDTHIAEEVNTARGVERIIRAAFDHAASHDRARVTMSDKSNAVPAHRIWQTTFKTVAAEYPGIQAEHRYVDALAMEMVRDPERFDVVVTTNLFGDILSDLAAGITGGLGLAPSANLHPGRPGLFEPVHGSAPTLTGTNTANPFAMILTAAMMLDELGHADAAQAVESAVHEALEAGVRTPDLAGTTGTREAAAWVAERVARA